MLGIFASHMEKTTNSLADTRIVYRSSLYMFSMQLRSMTYHLSFLSVTDLSNLFFPSRRSKECEERKVEE